jgi:hypothetical protein
MRIFVMVAFLFCAFIPLTASSEQVSAVKAGTNQVQPAADAPPSSAPQKIQSAGASGQDHAPPASDIPASYGFVCAILGMTLFLLLAVVFLAKLKKSDTWLLSDALSEEADGQTALAAGQKPVMVASASRLIAFIGLMSLLGVTVGVGYYVLWALFSGANLDRLDKVNSFITSSAIIFAPYAANQIKSAVASLGK